MVKFRFIEAKLRIFGDMLSYLSRLVPAEHLEDYSYLCTRRSDAMRGRTLPFFVPRWTFSQKKFDPWGELKMNSQKSRLRPFCHKVCHKITFCDKKLCTTKMNWRDRRSGQKHCPAQTSIPRPTVWSLVHSVHRSCLPSGRPPPQSSFVSVSSLWSIH